MKVEIIKPEETYALRHSVLRPHQKLIDCHYPGDFTSTTFHLGIRNDSTMVCIGSFYLETQTEFEDFPQYRLRGMATDSKLKGKKLGTLLHQEGEKILKQRSAKLLWCYAREASFGFYEKMGLQFHGHFFELPTIGRHKVMFKRI